MSVSVTSDLNLLNLPAADLSGIDVVTRDGFSGTWVGFAAGVSARKPRNVGVGYRLMTSSRDAAQNTAMGYSVAERLTGDNNVLVGAYVAQRVTARLTENVIVGATAAQYAANPLFRNVWIGYGQGFSNGRTSSNCIGIGADGTAIGDRVINIGTRGVVDGKACIVLGHDCYVTAQNNLVAGNRITNTGSNCLILKTNHQDVPWVNSNDDYLNINDVLISERLEDGQRRATLSNDVLRFKSALTSITLSNTFVSLDGVRSQISLGDVITFRGLYSSMVLDRDITFSGSNTSLVLAESGIVSYNGRDASLQLGSNIVYLQGSNATDIAVLGSNTGLLINSNSIALVGSNARDIVIAGSNARFVLSSNIQLLAPRANALTLQASNAGLFLTPTSASLCNASATSLSLVGSNATLVMAPTSVSLAATQATSIRLSGASNTELAITPSNIVLSGPSANSISLVASNNTRLLVTPAQMGMIGPAATLLSLTGCNMSFDMTPSDVTLSAPRAGRFVVTLSNATQLALTSNAWAVSGPRITAMNMSGASNALWRMTPDDLTWTAPTATRLALGVSNASFVMDPVGGRVDMVASNADPMRFVASNAVWTIGSRTVTGCNLHPSAVMGWVGPYGAAWTLDASNARLVGSNLVEASAIIDGGETVWRTTPAALEWIGSNARRAALVVGSNGSRLTIDAADSNDASAVLAASSVVRLSMCNDALDWRIARADPTAVTLSPAGGFAFVASSNVAHSVTRSEILTTGPAIRSWGVVGTSDFAWRVSDSNVSLSTPSATRWTVLSSNAVLDVRHDLGTRMYHRSGVRIASASNDSVSMAVDPSNVRVANATGGSNVDMTMTGSNTTFRGPVVMEDDPIIRGQTFSNWLATATPSTLSNLRVEGLLEVPGNAVINALTVSNLTALSNNIVITTVQMSSNTVTGFSNGIQVFGPATLDSNLYVRGSLVVDGPVTFSNPSFRAAGLVSLSGAGSVFRIDPPAQLVVGGAASFVGPCNVSMSGTGQFTVANAQPTIFRNADVIVQCNLVATGNDVFVQRRITVDGTATLAGPSVIVRSNLIVDGSSLLNGPLSVVNGSPATFGGPTAFLAPVSLCNDAVVLGAATFSNDVRIAGAIETRSNMRAYGTLDQYGPAFFWSNVYMHRALAVNGVATLCNALAVYGTAAFRSNVSLDQALGVAGPVSLSGPLVATGPYATFCNAVTVTQPLLATSNVTVRNGDVVLESASALSVLGGPVVIDGPGASFAVGTSVPASFKGPVDHYDVVRHWCNVDSYGRVVFYNSNTTACNALDVFGQLSGYGGAVFTGGPLITSNDFIALGAASRFGGGLTVEGPLEAQYDLIVRSNLTVQQGDLVVATGTSRFQGDAVQIDGVLRAFSNVLLFSNVDAFARTTVWQQLEARGTGADAFVVSRGNATMCNALWVGGSLSAAVGSTSADVTLGGRNMLVTTSNVLFSNHRFQVQGPLYAQSNAFLAARLVVNSNATFCNDLLVGRNAAVTSNVAVGGSLFTAGPVTISNTLDVTGQSANFWSNVFVNGILTANQLVTFSNVIQQTIVQIVGSNTTFSNDVVFLGRATFSNVIATTSNFTTTGLATFCNDLRAFGLDNRIGGTVTLANGAVTIDRSNLIVDSNARFTALGGPNAFYGSLDVYDTLNVYSNLVLHPPGGTLSVPTLDVDGPFTVRTGPITFDGADVLITGATSTVRVETSNSVLGGCNLSLQAPVVSIGDAADPSSLVQFPRGFRVLDGPVSFAGTDVVSFSVPVIGRCNVTLCNGLVVQGAPLTVSQDVIVGQKLSVAGQATLCNGLDVAAGSTRLRSNLVVDGDVIARSNVTVSNALDVLGPTTLSGGPVRITSASGPFSVASPATFCNALLVRGDATLSSDLFVAQTATVDRDLVVASSNGRFIVLGSEARFNSNTVVNALGPFNAYGPASFSNRVDIAADAFAACNLFVAGSLAVASAFTACNDLTVAGVATFRNTVALDGAVFGQSPWTLCNDLILASSNANASIAGNAFVGQALQVQGPVTACNGAQISGNVRIAANASNDALAVLLPTTFCNSIVVTGPGATATVSNLVIKGITTIGDPASAVEADDVVTIIPVAPTAPASNTTLPNSNALVGTAVVKGNIVFSNDVTILGSIRAEGLSTSTNSLSNITGDLSVSGTLSVLGGFIVAASNVTYCNVSNVVWTGSNPTVHTFQTDATLCNSCNLAIVGGTLDLRASNTAWRSNIDWYSGAVLTTRGDVTVSNDSNLVRVTGGSNGRMDLDQTVSIRDLTVRDRMTLSNIAWEGGIIALGASNETMRVWSNVPDQLQHRFDGTVIVDSNLYIGGRLFANGFTMTVIETLRAELHDLVVSGTMTLCNTTVEGVLTLGHSNRPPHIYSNIPDFVQHRTEGTLVVDSNLYVAGRIFCQGIEWSAANSMELYDARIYGTATFCNTAIEGVLRIGGSNVPYYAFSNIPNALLNTFQGAVHVEEDLYVSGKLYANGIEWSSLNNQVINDAVIHGQTTFCNAVVDGFLVLGSNGPNKVWEAPDVLASNAMFHSLNGALVVEENLYVGGKVFANGIEWAALHNQVVQDAVIQGQLTFCNARVDGYFILGSNGPYTVWDTGTILASNSTSHSLAGALVVEEDLYVGGKVYANGLQYTWCNVADYISRNVEATDTLSSPCNSAFGGISSFLSDGEVSFELGSKATFRTSNVLFERATQHRGPVQMMSGTATLPSWTISLSNDTPLVSDLVFRSKNDTVLTMTDDFTTGTLNFTGKHICRIEDADAALEDADLIGRVVVATGAYEDLDGSSALGSTDEAVPVVRLSRVPSDATAFGVIGAVQRKGTARNYSIGNLGFQQPRKRHASTRVVVHALGEGTILVKGPVHNGDLLVTSDVLGHAVAQNDDVVRACTVAKATCDCGTGFARIGCVYKC